MKIKLVYIIILFSVTRFSFAQENENRVAIYNAVDSLRQYKFQNCPFDSVNIAGMSTGDSLTALAVKWKYDYFQKGTLEGFPSSSTEVFEQDTSFNSVVFRLYLGDYLEEKGLESSLAYRHYLEAYEQAKKLKDSLLICESLKRMVDHVNDNGKNHQLLDTLSNRYDAYAFDTFEKDLARLHRNRAESLIESIPLIEEFMATAASAERNGNLAVLAYCKKLIGVKYDVYSKTIEGRSRDENLLSAISYYDEAAQLYARYKPSYFEKHARVGILNNKAIVFDFIKQYDSAKTYFLQVKDLMDSNDFDNQVIYHQWLAEHLRLVGDHDSAYHHKETELKLRRDSHTKQIDVSIAEINTKYETEKKELENLRLKADYQKVERNIRTYIIGAVSLLILLGSITLLLQKNATKKRLLVEKEKEIESQKVATLLKEQELANIDAMLAGQEKERLKVADELHDDLGSMMATIKLYIESYKKNQHINSIDQAQAMLNKAYEKIRNISRMKNSGVYSKDGLLPAIRKMTTDIMSASHLKIELMEFGMEGRLSNSIELNLFRAVQELIANIIKHADAKKIVIQFTQHNDSLNLMIEDDGVGFDVSVRNNDNHSGLGLSNIERRIELLDGSFMIDSIIGKGTSVIIDIPI
ncbi:MAG: ATP-binding protein [Bacteroidota bacterium]